jgi:glutathione reductase (NADPH)
VVHGAGRVPELDELDLDAGGVRRTDEGVEVNGYLQSVSNPSVYAAGDAAAAGAPLTPVAAMHGRVVAENILGGNQTPVDHTGVAAVVFTLPPLASVGLGELEATERGLDVDVRTGDASDWASTRRAGAGVAGYKVLIERGGGRILGAHLLGPGADEVVNLYALAVRLGLSADDLADARLAYPTHGSDIGYMIG